MDKTMSVDWGKLSSLVISDTLAYKNVKKYFPTQTEDVQKNIAALAIIGNTFPDNCLYSLNELKEQMELKFGIQNPLQNPKLLLRAFFLERVEDTVTLRRWIRQLADEKFGSWKYEDDSQYSADREIAKILSLNASKVQILKSTMAAGVPCIWKLRVRTENTGYAYVASLSKAGITPIWLSSLMSPYVFAGIAECAAGDVVAVISLFGLNPKIHGPFLSDIIEFVIQMNFQVIFIEDSNSCMSSGNDHPDKAINLETDINEPPSITEDVFASAFGERGRSIYNCAKEMNVDCRAILGMKTPIALLLSRCENEEQFMGTVRTLLSALTAEKKEEKKSEETRRFSDTRYSIDVINSSVSPAVLLKMAKKQQSNKMGLKFLFSGPSGTGKTAFAHYLSDELHIGLVTAKASDILHRSVGGSEQNTCALFQRAKNANKILLLDEVDAFLGRRDERDVNLRITATLVNQFLQELESFNGIFIGTTNVIGQLDSAFIRRFTRIVDFDYLNEDGIRTLLALYFPEYEFSEQKIKTLIHQGTVGPGDFGSVYSNLQFLDADETSPDQIIDSISALGGLREKKTVSNHIGFTVA